MKQHTFEERYGGRWKRFEVLLGALERESDLSFGARRKPLAPITPGDPTAEADHFPQLYRELCRDLSLADARRYSPRLLDRLNRLALGGHRQLYRRHTDFFFSFLRCVGRDFPAAVRSDWRFVASAAALFCLPGLAALALVLASPEMVYSVLSPDTVGQFERMYDPASERIGVNRSASSDIQMFGFYIWNNIGISFRTFATGLFFGLGSAFFLIHNSLILGALSAHIIQIGFETTFFSFMIGHGSFELTAIVLSGAAGLQLGYSLIAPGRLPRVESLRRASSKSIQLIYGVIGMLVIAAGLEAFWSSKGAVVPEIKFAVGAGLWAVVFLYFFLAGRGDAA